MSVRFGAYLRTLREDLGMNRAELAQRIGKQGSQVSRWEAGTVDPTYENVMRLARALGVPLHEMAEAAGMALEIPREERPTNPRGEHLKALVDGVEWMGAPETRYTTVRGILMLYQEEDQRVRQRRQGSRRGPGSDPASGGSG